MSNGLYIIDTCSLTKMRRDYPFDVFPSVWNFLGSLVDSRVVESIELVYDELSAQATDAVKLWADDHKAMFLPLDEGIQYRAVEILADYPTTLVDLRKRKSGADPFVIAAADVYECSVVTEEKEKRRSR